MKFKEKIFKNANMISVDQFFNHVLFDKKYGYYNKKYPFGKCGDFITSPFVSPLFSEMIAIWIISIWENFGKPNKFNIVELGPGDGKLIKILDKTFQKFDKFQKSINIYLYEKSSLLKKIQKKNIENKKIKWVTNFSKITDGPVIFIGNEFFDAIPIKQFLRKDSDILEKKFFLNKNNKILEKFTAAKLEDVNFINKFRTLKNNKFIEFPKLGFGELDKITKKISKNTGGILLIDYGYSNQVNKSTLQSVKKHKKNKLLDDLGSADITSLVNFKLLKEYFENKNLKVKNIVTQSFFLKKIGIVERANILSIKMSFKDKIDLYERLKRLLSPYSMGSLFKVIFAFKNKKNNFIGFN